MVASVFRLVGLKLSGLLKWRPHLSAGGGGGIFGRGVIVRKLAPSFWRYFVPTAQPRGFLIGRHLLRRLLQRQVLNVARSRVPYQVLRAGSSATWLRGTFPRGLNLSWAERGAFPSSALAQSHIFEKIRDFFETDLNGETDESRLVYPKSFGSYNTGEMIAKGCNGAVYEAKIVADFEKSWQIAGGKNCQNLDLSAGNDYPLALKMVFNYYDEVKSVGSLFKEMGEELVPVLDESVKALLRGYHFRPPPKGHVNMVRMYTAFVDAIPPPASLKDSLENFPETFHEIHDNGVSEVRTVFLVMKRYSMTLRTYLDNISHLLVRVPVRTGQILFAQLLEGLLYLQNCRISHRDLKSDNVLLDFNDYDGDIPHLVLGDFGSCMASGTLNLNYCRDYVDLGGNYALRAPEIVTARPPAVLDYSKADLWAAATLAYEIFTGRNPFYADLSSEKYDEQHLPKLEEDIPSIITTLVYAILKREPKQRPSVGCASTVASLSLFCTEKILSYLEEVAYFEEGKIGLIDRLKTTAGEVISLFAAETILLSRRRPLSEVELTLRRTFLARVQQDHVVEALVHTSLP